MCDPDETRANGGGPYCFPDTIVRVGSTNQLTVFGIGCVPATGSAAINTIIGLPGPRAWSSEYEIVALQ